MHLIFISSCKKKAAKRTIQILDRYASRIGPRTWSTPITSEASLTLRQALSKSASKNSSVVCFKNKGKNGLTFQWSVGRQHISPLLAQHPISYSSVKPVIVDDFTSITCILSFGQGISHDLGKAPVLFQYKLRDDLPSKDPIRHEWISMLILLKLETEESLEVVLSQIEQGLSIEDRKNPFQKYGIKSLKDVLIFGVLTHHKMCSPSKKCVKNKNESLVPNEHAYIRNVENHPYYQDPSTYLAFFNQLASNTRRELKKSLRRISKASKKVSTFKGITLLSRASLIAADHVVSKRRVEARKSTNNLYANTAKEGGKRILNQSLDYHLDSVAVLASEYSKWRSSYKWYGLTEETKENICTPNPPESRFKWQDDAALAAAELRSRTSEPIVVFNTASTGSGKTRMNARLACIVNQRNEVRFTYALNLRTLTLQTGRSFSQDLKILPQEMNCIIGDRTTKQLFDNDNPDENEYESEPISANFEGIVPAWFSEYAEAFPDKAKVILPPVLVSTIDFIIAAGDPSKQGHHAAALFRLANSDLILDEVDSYDTKAFVAVLRLIQVAGIVGSNLIVSSATLPVTIISAIIKAYQSGRKFSKLDNNSTFNHATLFVDNYQDPMFQESENSDAHTEKAKHFSRNALLKMKGRSRQKPILARCENKGQSITEAILKSCRKAHSLNCWTHPTGKKISFGLVRVTFIKDAIEVAKYLSKAIPDAYIATYHSKEFVIQRYLKEKHLDHLLNRKKGNQYITTSSYINSLINRIECDSIPFIVVATQVEEIGRDHDFDWGVIEPWSTRSLVQACGRIFRHRLIYPVEPNIWILQHSLKAARSDIRRFEFERTKTWDKIDFEKLINWDDVNEINAGLRLNTDCHELAKMEEKSIRRQLKYPLNRLICENNVEWLTQKFYDDYPLREWTFNERWIKREDGFYVESNVDWRKRDSEFRTIESCERVDNDWLVWSEEELREQCLKYEIDAEIGMSFQFEQYGMTNNENFRKPFWDMSFGFHDKPI